MKTMDFVRRTCNRAIRLACKEKIHTILTGVFLVLILVGCRNEEFSENRGDEEMTVQFSLQLPYAETRGLGEADESEVREIDVLMFEPKGTGVGTGEFFTRISCNSSITDEGGKPRIVKFEARLRQGTYNLWIFANAKDRIDNAMLNGGLSGKNESAVSAILDKSLPAGGKWITDMNVSGYQPIPMWGKADGVEINETTNLSGVKAVGMHRMLARADVRVSAANFRLESVHLYNYLTYGQMAPVPDNWNTGNNIAVKSSEPPTAVRTRGPLTYDNGTISANACTGEIYLFETSHSKPNNGGAKDRSERTCLVVGGKWDEYGNGFSDDPTTYYRMDFSTGTGSAETFKDVLRSHQYTFDITKVESEGYGSKEDAFNGVSRLIATVSEWNTAEQHVASEEQYFLRVSGDELLLSAQGGEKEVTMETDHPDGVRIDAATIEYDPPGTPWITLATKGGSAGSGNWTVGIDAGINSGTTERRAVIDVKAGNITKKINLAQKGEYYPAMHSGWAGSNIYWDGSRFTFDDVNDHSHENYQGVYFQWGSLWGIAPDGSQQSPWSTNITVYKLDNGGHSATTGNSWNSFPRVSDIHISSNPPSGKSVRDRHYLYEITDGSAGIGDICKYLTEQAGGSIHGKKWRMPTSQEFEAANSYSRSGTWADVTSNNAGGQYQNPNAPGYRKSDTGTPFFPASGYRNNSIGQLYSVGNVGSYWSGSPDGTIGYSIGFNTVAVFPATNNDRPHGFCVRCVAE